MKLSFGFSNEGISLSLGEGVVRRLKLDTLADQSRPRRSYVYAHVDEQQVPFYIGMGTGRRAWHAERHFLWHRYVEKHLHGKYSVVILQDDLTPTQAEETESAWITQESETVVNWISLSRPIDLAALGLRTRLRDANLETLALARSKEKSDPAEAIATYRQALDRLAEYANIQYELGLVGQLLDEEAREVGISGELQILDRLTLCLAQVGRGVEAFTITNEYFASYRLDLALGAAARIQKRVARANALKGGA